MHSLMSQGVKQPVRRRVGQNNGLGRGICMKPPTHDGRDGKKERNLCYSENHPGLYETRNV